MLILCRICATHTHKKNHSQQGVHIYTIMLSHDPQAKIKRSIVRYIYIQAYIASIYIYIYLWVCTRTQEIRNNPTASKIALQNSTNQSGHRHAIFLAKGGECHEFPLPIAPSRISSWELNRIRKVHTGHKSCHQILMFFLLLDSVVMQTYHEKEHRRSLNVWGHVRRKVSHQDPLPSQLPGV